MAVGLKLHYRQHGEVSQKLSCHAVWSPRFATSHHGDCGQVIKLRCARVFSYAKWTNNSTFPKWLLWPCDKIVHINCLEKYLVHNKPWSYLYLFLGKLTPNTRGKKMPPSFTSFPSSFSISLSLTNNSSSSRTKLKYHPLQEACPDCSPHPTPMWVSSLCSHNFLKGYLYTLIHFIIIFLPQFCLKTRLETLDYSS